MLVIQGTWDLGTTIFRNVIHNKHYVEAVLEAVKTLASKNCSDVVKLIFVQTMPYPTCEPNHEECTRSSGWRLNPSIAAMSQYFERELLKSNYSNVVVVDAGNIIRPSKSKYDCMNHFLCRHGQLENFRIAKSSGGVSLASEIIRALCN